MSITLMALCAALNRHEAKLRIVLFGASLLPALLLANRFYQQDLGINPFATLSHACGHWALIFLLLTLAITPVRRGLRLLCSRLRLTGGKRLSDWHFLIHGRRQLGLFAFFYMSLHLLVYLELEAFWEWDYLRSDVSEKPYLLLGMLAYGMTALLAATSPKIVIRHLHRWWRRLHRLMYLLTPLAILHYSMAVKPGVSWPMVAGAICALLLLQRLCSHWLTRVHRTAPASPIDDTPQRRQTDRL